MVPHTPTHFPVIDLTSTKPVTGNGFTLIEFLIALAAMSLILGAAYAVLFAGLQSYRTCVYDNEVQTVLQRALERIMEDLSCAGNHDPMLFRVTNHTMEFREGQEIPQDRVLFQSHVGRLNWESQPQMTYSEIEIFVDTDEETPYRWLVRRSQSPVDDDLQHGGTIHLLGPRIIGMDVLVYDGIKWHEEWESSTRLPQAVQICLFMEPSLAITVPKKIESKATTVWLPLGEPSSDLHEQSTDEDTESEMEGLGF